jgi:predicted glycosyltransferase
MTPPIGYYVHHHGEGHRSRALAIAHAASGCFTLIGTGLAGRTEGIDCLDLPDDRLPGSRAFDGEDGADDRSFVLHYAPLHHASVRARVGILADWIRRMSPSLLVVDVSVEIAMLARLAATPTIYVRLGGDRVDLPHLEAFSGARALLAPFHEDLDQATGVNWVHAKTRYFPGLTTARWAANSPLPNTVLAVYGAGGPMGDGEALAAAARATPTLDWRAIGRVSQPTEKPANLALLGWVDNADEEIASAGVLIGSAGDGLVSTAIATQRPFICIAQARPFNEQFSKARRLDDCGAAVVLERWPAASDWPELIAAARALEPEALARLHDPDGPRHAAQFIIATANEGMPRADK